MNRLRLFLLLIILFPAFLLPAQQQRDFELTLASPYNTIYGHLYFLQPDSYLPDSAARVFFGIADEAQAQRLAIQLKQIYDGQGLYVQVNQLPREPDYRDTTSGQFLYTLFPKQLPEVFLERIDGRWYYSAETVGQIPALHKSIFPFGADLLVNSLGKLGQNKVLGLAVWQYTGLLILLLLALVVHFILSRLLRPLVRRLSRSRLYPSLIPPALIWTIARLISIWVVLRVIRLFLPPLQLPIEAAEFALIIIRIVSIILVVFILLRVLDVVMLYADSFTRRTESKLDEQLIPIIRRTLQAIVILAGIFQILRGLNVDVTTLIAGISIGGLALALAAQDTLKNFFGSLMIFLDRPFQIGDWINFGDIDGTVEEVGFRSTRVRTFANSLVYVPNGKLADMTVNNYGLRVYRRFSTKINITYDTPPLLIEKFVEGLQAIVATHPQTRKDYFEVHLNDMSAHSLDILFYIFFEAPGWSDELKAKHEVLLAIIRLADQLGVRFAFPTSTIHVEELPGRTPTTPSYIRDAKAAEEELQKFLAAYRQRLGEQA